MHTWLQLTVPFLVLLTSLAQGDQTPPPPSGATDPDIQALLANDPFQLRDDMNDHWVEFPKIFKACSDLATQSGSDSGAFWKCIDGVDRLPCFQRGLAFATFPMNPKSQGLDPNLSLSKDVFFVLAGKQSVAADWITTSTESRLYYAKADGSQGAPARGDRVLIERSKGSKPFELGTITKCVTHDSSDPDFGFWDCHFHIPDEVSMTINDGPETNTYQVSWSSLATLEGLIAYGPIIDSLLGLIRYPEIDTRIRQTRTFKLERPGQSFSYRVTNHDKSLMGWP